MIVLTLFDEIQSKIQKLDAKIGVIGLGQVGLPTALAFYKSGFNVIGNDINENIITNLNSGISSFEEKEIKDLIESTLHNNKFHATSDIKNTIEQSDILIVCVATPLTENAEPDLSALKTVCNSFSQRNMQGKLVIIESSIPPGTFEGIILPMLKKKNKIGVDCWAAFVPERLTPGQALTEINTIPRIIGYTDEKSSHLAELLYKKIVKTNIIAVPVKAAEISKLVENTFRYVNIALANEIGLLCEDYGIDFNELIKVCNSHPRVHLHKPGPGVGGPCLPKDPILLINPYDSKQFESKIILQAKKINDGMPFHVTNMVLHSLEEQNKIIEGATITVLGVAYKADIGDSRNSPSKKIITQLLEKKCKVLVYDPKTKENFGGKTINDIWKAISESDVLVVVTDHKEFREMNLEKIQKSMKRPTIVDTRRIFDHKIAKELGINYYSIGLGHMTCK